MAKQIIACVVGAIIAGVALFFILNIPSDFRKQLLDIDRRLSRLEGSFETFTKLREEFSELQEKVKTVEGELKDVSSTVQSTQSNFRFLEPIPGSTVSRYFRVRGTVSNPPEAGHLWLAVEWGGLAWPKEPEVRITDTEWFGEVNEGGSPPNGRFRLSIWSVNNNGHQKINEWLKEGHSSGNYPGLPGLPEGVRLNGIELQLE